MGKTKRQVDSHQEQEDTEPLHKVAKEEKANSLDHSKASLQNMKKPDLLKYCKELEVKFEKLQEYNKTLTREKEDDKNNIIQLKESLNVLELKIKVLQQQEENFKYHCGDCDFETDCVHCFGDHDHEDDDANEQVLQIMSFKCYFCEETFSTKACVMRHTKLIHCDKVSHCLNFLDGTCSFGERCWFLHDERFKDSEPTFKCNFCDSRFLTKLKLMNHKKLIHIDSVSKCSKDNCIYGAEKCWFVHAENIEQAFEIAKTVTTNNILKENKKFTDMKT